MTTLPEHIEELFYHTLVGSASIEEFEQWLYADRELESWMSPEDYLDLISLHFKDSGASHELGKLIRKQVDLGKYETWKLRRLLRSVKDRTGDYPRAIIAFYDQYCHGYSFLDNLSFGYGLDLVCPRSISTADSYEQLTVAERDWILNQYYPAIQEEVAKVLGWLETGKIRLTGTVNELGHHEFVDERAEDEKAPTAYRTEQVPEMHSSTEKGSTPWKFWK